MARATAVRLPSAAPASTKKSAGREVEALAAGDRQQLLLPPGRDGAAADPAADGGLPDAQQLGDALLRAELADDVLDGVPAHRGS